MHRRQMLLLAGAPLAALGQTPPALKGDGQTDETAALQRWADTRAPDFRLPPGRFRITRPIEIRLDRAGPLALSGAEATLVMAGAGPALRITGTHKGTAGPSTVHEGVWRRERTPLIDGLEIVGAHPEAGGIRLEGTMQATFTRLVIRETRDAMVLTGRNRNVIVSECHIYNNRGPGILFDQLDLHQVNIANCHISYNRRGGIVIRGGQIRNLQIGSCDIEGNMDPEGPPAANVDIDTGAGAVREGAIIGCTLQHTKAAAGSANIRMVGQSAERAHRAGFFSIANNAFSDVGVNVHLRYARGVVIAGNTFWEGKDANVLVEYSSDIVLSANIMDRNPDYRDTESLGHVVFADCRDVAVRGLHMQTTLHAEAALVLRRCRRAEVSDTVLLNSQKAALLLDHSEGVRVSNCRMENDAGEFVALRVRGGRNNIVRGSLLAGTVDAEPGTATIER
ncbi:MAG: right-handed parallel beta-helix repeat-containing protein [Bryobacterales bacterium]|nr:right-handed parallel beta-helix repeat-containing protein [Bryobacterales bacterium]